MSGGQPVQGTAGAGRTAPPPPGALRPFAFPSVHRRTLGNGARVVCAPVRDAPVVTLNIALDAGALRDDPARLGLAALTAELLESGTADRSAADVAREIESLGVQLDAGAGWDMAHAGITALANRFQPAADILADLVREPSFPAGEVERLRAERLAEILQRLVEPRALASEAAARFIYHPDARMSRPLGGTVDTLPSLTRQDIAAFHGEFFSPAAARFVVVGDIDPDDCFSLLERRFDDWSGPAAIPPAVPTAPRSEDVQVIVVDRPGAVQSEIRIGHIGVPRSTERFFAIQVMNAILGGTFTSRLNLNLRERNGFTYGVSSGFAMRRRTGSFVVSTAVQTEVTAAAVTEILGELRAIRSADVLATELDDARSYLAGVFPLRLQTTDGIAGRLLELMIHELPDDYFETYRDRLLAVTAAEVREAAEHHVRPDSVAIVVAGDAAALRPSLEALGLGEARVIQPDAIQAA
jgi:zinc protease